MEQAEGKGGAVPDGPSGVGQLVFGDSGGVDDREPPVVQGDVLREQLGADAVALAGDRVDNEVIAHAHGSGTGVGSTWRLGRRQPPARWSAISSAKTSSALRRKPTAPSGNRQAPRPSIMAAQRSS